MRTRMSGGVRGRGLAAPSYSMFEGSFCKHFENIKFLRLIIQQFFKPVSGFLLHPFHQVSVGVHRGPYTAVPLFLQNVLLGSR